MGQMQIDNTDFFGGAVDIAKCVDQVSRHLLYRLASVAGMPKGILQAYRGFQEHLVVYNTIARGVGKPYKRRCGIPQGCPFSMMLIALVMRPWVVLMEQMDTVPWILADDILLLVKGESKEIPGTFTNAMHVTHLYLYDMGPKLAPSKSNNFASTPYGRKWLRNSRWPSIKGHVAVLQDFRYLGAHASTTGRKTGRTLRTRFHRAIAMLKRLGSMPLTMEAKLKALRGKQIPMAFYGIEVACPGERLLTQFTAAVMKVIGGNTTKTEIYLLFSCTAGEGDDPDPVVQILIRRVM